MRKFTICGRVSDAGLRKLCHDSTRLKDARRCRRRTTDIDFESACAVRAAFGALQSCFVILYLSMRSQWEHPMLKAKTCASLETSITSTGYLQDVMTPNKCCVWTTTAMAALAFYAVGTFVAAMPPLFLSCDWCPS